MPVTRVQDRVEGLATGDRLTAICTDPGALEDIPAWRRVSAPEALSTADRNGKFLVTLCVGRHLDQ
jgi:tRNA 2-thiouridine synthesizing protein A